MREWLYIIMNQLAQRAEIPDYLDMLEEARTEANHSHAVIWKFCDLDTSPHDRYVSRRELMYTIQSLKALEHCLVPFLDQCDTDDDGQITLWEWGRCLGLPESTLYPPALFVRFTLQLLSVAYPSLIQLLSVAYPSLIQLLSVAYPSLIQLLSVAYPSLIQLQSVAYPSLIQLLSVAYPSLIQLLSVAYPSLIQLLSVAYPSLIQLLSVAYPSLIQ
nr:hypothetical protein BaRGS_006694 [Batillaria attramentaria]